MIKEIARNCILTLFWGLICFSPGIFAQQLITKDTLEAKQLLTEAKTLLGQGQLEGVEVKLNQASALVERALGKENALYADVLHQLGRFQFSNNDVHAGIAYTQQALDIRLKVFGYYHLDVAQSYFNLGNAYGGWQIDFEKAVEYRQKTWEIRKKLLGENHQDVINTWKALLFAQGINYVKKAEKAQKNKNWDLAIKLLLQADSVFLIQKNDEMVFHVKTTLGIYHHDAGKFQKSIDACQVALSYVEIIGQKDSLEEAALLNTYGSSLLELNRLDESEKAYFRALAIKTQLYGPGAAETGAQLSNLATVYLRRGQFKKAIQFSKEGIAVREKGAVPPEELLNAYIHLAFFYNTAGIQHEALALYQKAEQILAKNPTKHQDLAGAVYDGLGSAYQELGDFDKALAYKQLAILSFTKVFGPHYPLIARTQFNLGHLAVDREDWPAVIDHARSALKIIQQNPNDVNPTFLIDVYEQLSDGLSRINLDSSLYYAQHALHLCETLVPDDDFAYSSSLVHLGLIYNQFQRFSEADSLLKIGEAKFLERFGAKHNLTAFLSTSRAQALAQMGNYPAALEKYETALQVYGYTTGMPWESLVNPNPVLSTLQEKNHILIQLYQQSKSTALAKSIEENFSEILTGLNYLRRNYQGSETKLLFARQFKSAAEDAINWYQAISDPQTLEKAWIFAEKSRSLAVLEAFLNSKAWQAKGASDSTRITEELFAAATKKWSKAYEMAKTIAEKDSCYRLLLETRVSHESWLKELEQRDSVFFNLKYSQNIVDIKSVQRALDEQQTLLEYFVADSSIYIFLIQPKHHEIVAVKKDAAFEQWITDLNSKGIYGYHALPRNNQNPILREKTLKNYSAAAYKLYETLIAPVKAKLDKKVIIIPDGVLGYVPFEALLTQKPPRPDAIGNYQYLLKDHQVSYCYSATLLREMRHKQHRQEPAQKLLAMAPFFLANSAKIPSQTDPPANAGSREVLTELPHSGPEIAAISKLLNGHAFFGKEATLNKFQELASRYRILHLSTHGKADDRLGDYAYLAFGMPNAQGVSDKLYARDLYNLSLNADLVVLSACETGIGKLQAGEGIVSLARAFAYAGAKSMITTLWKVKDERSKEIMASFYQYLNEGKDKDEALRQAKLDFLQKNADDTALLHPFFWAGFIGIGDMHPIK
ncbi:CHAT domain-containing protein [Haliscomenobacter hydrossis]|uniref:Tetratricopeptide TPR_1 repeat-containing protein n=1 Tax=Haliscomenobacter hydrossis (strain ATCC 27775 / DSM 1100 / LMG 10767 / O) TaxID=760192 RepID=F4KUL2_HALH1|nr:CHAT domain-containing protein [Haliscomenobacter hydrossis]AEE52448.1 Tetratricopeptide TPR_1 repeat-containing protein [Haliscomenobacter hydrossis DSM 1100]